MMNGFKGLGVFIALLFYAIAGNAEVIRTNFSIYPIEVSTTIDQRRTVSYSLTNITNTPVIIHVSPDFLRVGKLGKAAKSPFTNDQMIAEYNDEQFALRDVQVSEPYVIVRPRQNKVVRVSFSIAPNSMPGTYRANILFTPEMNTDEKDTQDQKTTSTDDLGINIQYVLAQEVSIYANKGTGNAESTGMTCQYDQKAGQLVLQISNTTNWLFKPEVSIYSNSKSSALNRSKIIPVMPQTQAERFITISGNHAKPPYYLMWKLPNSKLHKINCS